LWDFLHKRLDFWVFLVVYLHKTREKVNPLGKEIANAV